MLLRVTFLFILTNSCTAAGPHMMWIMSNDVTGINKMKKRCPVFLHYGRNRCCWVSITMRNCCRGHKHIRCCFNCFSHSDWSGKLHALRCWHAHVLPWVPKVPEYPVLSIQITETVTFLIEHKQHMDLTEFSFWLTSHIYRHKILWNHILCGLGLVV